MSEIYQRLSHLSWDCNTMWCSFPSDGASAVWASARQLGEIFHALARQKECQIIEGHLMPDHVHMCIAIPPKYPVASVIGFLKGRVRLRWPACVAKSGISRANTSGPVVMQCPPWALNWSKCANTSANRSRGW